MLRSEPAETLEGTGNAIWNGRADTDAMRVPLTRNTTDATPTLSAASADSSSVVPGAVVDGRCSVIVGFSVSGSDAIAIVASANAVLPAASRVVARTCTASPGDAT